MPPVTKHQLPSKPFSDMDLLFLLLGFSTYITIRFVVESGWIIGTLLTVSTFFLLRKSSVLRHTLYLYAILLFTSPEEQKWLLRKFSLNSQKYPRRGQKDHFEESHFTDAINQTLKLMWPFVKSVIEEKIRKKIDDVIVYLNDATLTSFLQNLVHLKAEEINLGTQPPLVESLRLFPSRRSNVVIYGIGFRYKGNASLTFATNVTKFSVENLKVEGRVRIEIGPLSPHPPFFHEIRVCMTEDPLIDFTVSNTPEKIENLAKIMCLEKIGEKLIMPNQIYITLQPVAFENYFPPGVILFHIVEARDLPNKETFRYSDPFCVIRFGGEKCATPIIRNTLNPVWNFKTQMICSCDPRSGDFDASFTIYDKDVFLNDFLFRSTLSARKILEKQFIDEWLPNEVVEHPEKKNQEGTGMLHVQAMWRDFSSAQLPFQEEETMQFHGHNDASASFINRQHSKTEESGELTEENSEETTQPQSCEENSKTKNILAAQFQKKDETPRSDLFEAVLLVWIESAEKLETAWEDFQIELKLHDNLKKTPFASRDSGDMWHFRHRILIPVKQPDEDEISFKGIERMSPPYINALCRAEMESGKGGTGISFRHGNSDRAQPQLDNLERDETTTRKPSKTNSVFKFTEIGWDVYPAFVLNTVHKTTSAIEEPANMNQNQEAKGTSELSDVSPFVRSSKKEQSSAIAVSKAPSQHTLQKRSSKRWLNWKRWTKSDSSSGDRKP